MYPFKKKYAEKHRTKINVIDENSWFGSRIQIWILYTEAWIRESGSIKKCNGSAKQSKTKLGARTCTQNFAAAAASTFSPLFRQLARQLSPLEKAQAY
jgi:hypothetical protein